MGHFIWAHWLHHEWLRESEKHRLYRVIPASDPPSESSLRRRLGNSLSALKSRLKRERSYPAVISARK